MTMNPLIRTNGVRSSCEIFPPKEVEKAEEVKVAAREIAALRACSFFCDGLYTKYSKAVIISWILRKGFMDMLVSHDAPSRTPTVKALQWDHPAFAHRLAIEALYFS